MPPTASTSTLAPGAASSAIAGWVDERLRACSYGIEAVRWTTRDGVSAPPAVAEARAALARAYGIRDERAAARVLTGWLAGPAAAAVGAIAVRDGAGVDLAASGGIELGLAEEGYVAEIRIADPRIAVLPGHPWAGRAGVTVAGDERALDELVVGGIVRWAEPIVVALEPSGRATAPVWAQIPDALGSIPGLLAALEPEIDPQRWIERVEPLMTAAPATWRRTPRIWTADAAGRPVVVAHRSGCCMFYRAEEPDDAEPEAIDADYLARFGNEPPHYCGTCRLREAGDVEARAVYWALRAQAAEA